MHQLCGHHSAIEGEATTTVPWLWFQMLVLTVSRRSMSTLGPFLACVNQESDMDKEVEMKKNLGHFLHPLTLLQASCLNIHGSGSVIDVLFYYHHAYDEHVHHLCCAELGLERHMRGKIFKVESGSYIIGRSHVREWLQA